MLWQQKSASREDFVIWDYHVLLVLRPRTTIDAKPSQELHADDIAWIYDFDTRLSNPCDWRGRQTSRTDFRQEHLTRLCLVLKSISQGHFPTCMMHLFRPSSLQSIKGMWFCPRSTASDRTMIESKLASRCSLFRVVPADAFLNYFASDRSHMVSLTSRIFQSRRKGSLLIQNCPRHFFSCSQIHLCSTDRHRSSRTG